MMALNLAAAADLMQESLFDSDGYRIAAFLAPVPASCPGAETLFRANQLQALMIEGAIVLIDVLPMPARPEGLPPATLWLPPSHENIPGSVWLPNVGYGRLSEELDAYFKRHLGRLVDDKPDTRLVIYCKADCWMSWNAARRAAGYGYRAVYWYPGGTTDWAAAGLPLAKAIPVPLE
ncbi:rhodanese-like domain-containing protein [Thiocapsa rosea]|nr:rhodanese-like domain-containing protein [Thiocapsa rosea]